jgi:predicted ATP-dependent endonuclease of OLD family
MKRYWLFQADQYYPNGGMSDFIGDYDSVSECEGARTANFDPNLSLNDVVELWKTLQKTTPLEELKKIRPNYQEMFKQVERGRDTGYHILDIQERVIVQGWDQFEKKVIERTPLTEFK